MQLNRILYIKDSTEKYMEVYRFLRRQEISEIEWGKNAEEAVEMIESAIEQGKPYDLLLSDMQFDYFGKDDREAGEKLMDLLRSKNIMIPVIFCSSQNWKIPGALGNIFYNPRRDWELEAERLFREVRNR